MPIRRSDDRGYPLLENGSATGSAVQIPGGFYTFCADGTLAGATLSLQMQMPNGTWANVRYYGEIEVLATTTPEVHVGIPLPACWVRAALTGGVPTGVHCHLTGEG